MNGLTLAYLGDPYFELEIRKYLISQNMTNVNKLHKEAIKFTSGQAQASMMYYLLDNQCLTEDEIDLYKRGRNSSGPGRKNIDAKTYHDATGFEALIGGLSITNKDRANELIKLCIEIIEKGDL